MVIHNIFDNTMRKPYRILLLNKTISSLKTQMLYQRLLFQTKAQQDPHCAKRKHSRFVYPWQMFGKFTCHCHEVKKKTPKSIELTTSYAMRSDFYRKKACRRCTFITDHLCAMLFLLQLP